MCRGVGMGSSVVLEAARVERSGRWLRREREGCEAVVALMFGVEEVTLIDSSEVLGLGRKLT